MKSFSVALVAVALAAFCMQSASTSTSTLPSLYDNADDVVDFILKGLKCSMKCFEKATRGTKLEKIWAFHKPGIRKNKHALKGCLELSGAEKEM